MDPLFSTTPVRPRLSRGQRSYSTLGPRWHDPWPPPDRDPNDPAVVATRLLATAGRMESRLRRIARTHHVDPRVLRFLLLFTERSGPLRVTDVAENMGISRPGASRIVGRALDAGLVDRNNHSGALDGRVVSVRLTVAGRDAVRRGLEALRAETVDLDTRLDPPRHGASNAYGYRYALREEAPFEI